MKRENGFSLIEMLIVLVIAGILIAFILPSLKNTAGDGKKVSADIENSLRERRSSAIELDQANIEGMRRAAPLAIDFNNLATTAPLKIDGLDANHDGLEDRSGVSLTRLIETTGTWNYAYEGQPIKLPTGWQIASGISDLGSIPLIPNAQLVTTIAFDDNGRPVGTPVPNVAPAAGRDEAPFYVVIARDVKAGNIAVAVAVHQSGLIEKWTYNFTDGVWTGAGGRQ